MATFIPKFRLYDSTGTTLLYTFTAVDFTNAPQSTRDTVQMASLRSQGEIIVDGGDSAWDLQMRFHILGNDTGDDYEGITSQIEDLENTIEMNTPYLLRLDKTDSTYFQWKVKRIVPFIYEEGLRVSFTRVQAVFRANSW